MTAEAFEIVTLPGSAPREATRRAKPQRVRARYDAAQTTVENRKHWANADHLSAAAAHSPEVRRVLRIRSRYELANCPLARSILRKHADFVVGTGPRLQVNLPREQRTLARMIQERFRQWAIASQFARKLWLMRYDKSQNGESFAILSANYNLPDPVKLDVTPVEADRVTAPSIEPGRDQSGDGIVYDDFGNPVQYQVLRQHPGDTFASSGFALGDVDRYDAQHVIHYFSSDRAGQKRGVPEITSALPLFAFRRRFLLATIAAAETAVNLAGVLETQQPPEDWDTAEPFDVVDIERDMLMTLPGGYKLAQMKAEHPATTFEMFDNALIREIARCMNMPYGIAASDSSSYNFASGKLDHLPYMRTVTIDQDHLEDVAADRIFHHWFSWAKSIDGYLPGVDASTPTPPHDWFWDGQELLDPREAGAIDIGLRNGSQTLPRVYAKRGQDADVEHEAMADLLGMTVDEYRAELREQLFGDKAEVDRTQLDEPQSRESE